MGATEQIAKAAHSVSDAMKAQPLALALLIVNALFLIMLTWVLHEVMAGNRLDTAQRDTLINELRKSCEANRAQPQR